MSRSPSITRPHRFGTSAGDDILGIIADIHTNKLWQFNFELIIGIRDYLGIETPLSMAKPSIGGRSVGLVSVLKRYTPDSYLSGTGAKVYMGECEEFTEAGIAVKFSNHDP